jgi:hypothetical protein
MISRFADLRTSLQKIPAWGQFLGVFLAVLAIVLYINITFPIRFMLGDALAYIDLANKFFYNGAFSLLHYSNVLRGYFFPLLLVLPVSIGRIMGIDRLIVFRIISAVCFAFLITIMLPIFFRRVFHLKITALQTLLFSALMIFFWHGHVAYPMSDLPGLALFFMAILVYLVLMDPADRPIWQRLLLAFLLGFLLAGAILTRPSYLFSFGIMILLVLWRLTFDGIPWLGKRIILLWKHAVTAEPVIKQPSIRNLPVLQRAGIALMLLVGSIVVLAPEAMSNWVHWKVISPLPLGEHQKVNLTMFQLYYGLYIQHIDFGAALDASGEGYVPANVMDEQGLLIVQKKDLKLDQSFSLKQYLEVVFQYPLDFATLYFRHLLNGLDLVYPTPYVADVTQNQIPYRFVNYTVLFLAFSALWKRGVNLAKDAEKLVILFLVFLSVLVAVPGAIETRFFLPIDVLVYGCVSYWVISRETDWKAFFSVGHVFAYLSFMILCFMFSASNFSFIPIILN